MKNVIDKRTFGIAVAFAALAAVSCAKVQSGSSGASSPAADEP